MILVVGNKQDIAEVSTEELSARTRGRGLEGYMIVRMCDEPISLVFFPGSAIGCSAVTGEGLSDEGLSDRILQLLACLNDEDRQTSSQSSQPRAHRCQSEQNRSQ